MNVDAKCMNGAWMRKHILELADPMLVKHYAGIIRRVRRNRRRAVCVCVNGACTRCIGLLNKPHLLHAGKITVGVSADIRPATRACIMN
jgi:hypothetical protein